jgi:hypothetical protein
VTLQQRDFVISVCRLKREKEFQHAKKKAVIDIHWGKKILQINAIRV